VIFTSLDAFNKEQEHDLSHTHGGEQKGQGTEAGSTNLG